MMQIYVFNFGFGVEIKNNFRHSGLFEISRAFLKCFLINLVSKGEGDIDCPRPHLSWLLNTNLLVTSRMEILYQIFSIPISSFKLMKRKLALGNEIPKHKQNNRGCSYRHWRKPPFILSLTNSGIGFGGGARRCRPQLRYDG